MRAKRASRFRVRVIICQHDTTTSANSDGEIPETEKEVARRWASIEPIRGREREINDQLQADVTHRIVLRYDQLTSAMDHTYWLKVQKSGDRYNVTKAYDPDWRRREIHLDCTQRV